MIERNCWTILAQRAQDETTLIQTEIGQITTRLENLNASKERLQNLYEEYRKQENSTNSNLLGMREVINQRQFMTQLLITTSTEPEAMGRSSMSPRTNSTF